MFLSFPYGSVVKQSFKLDLGRPSLSIVVVDYLLDDLIGGLIHEIAGRRRNVLHTASSYINAERCGCGGSASGRACRSSDAGPGHVATVSAGGKIYDFSRALRGLLNHLDNGVDLRRARAKTDHHST